LHIIYALTKITANTLRFDVIKYVLHLAIDVITFQAGNRCTYKVKNNPIARLQ